MMEKQTKRNEKVEVAENEELLKAYNEQTNATGEHAYSEVWHSDYSDSSCCC